jgi:CheY-like chemotaxis protein
VGCRREGHDRLRLEVHDTGRGIATTDQVRIFEEYRRIDTNGGTKHDGLGLGLAIVARLASLLGHEIKLRSTLHRGSVFSITVPRSHAPQPVASDSVPTPVSDIAGRSILVVDDDPAICNAMARMLRDWRCEPVTAGSLAQACSLAADCAPDLIVSDYHLGDHGNGLAVIDAVRETVGDEIPALLITGDTSPRRLEEARRAGHLLLRKPVAPARLRAALSHLLR